MKNDFLISVVIPCYNLKDHITRTLDSVFAQTYASIEVIAVDDGSTDGTAEILDVYRRTEERLAVIHQQNAGVSAARLTGIKAAKGDYIGFVDGDDLIDKDMYERLLQNAIDHDADISHCGYDVIKAEGKKSFFYNTGVFEESASDEATKKLILGQYEPTLCTKLFKLSAVRELLNEQKIDLNIKINEDLLVNFFLFRKANRIVFEDFCPYHYVKRAGSASSSKLNRNHIYDPIKVRRSIFDELQGTPLEGTAKAVLLTAYRNAYHRIITANDKTFSVDKKELRSRIAEERDFIRTLSVKERILYALIIHAPALYTPIYKFYVLRRDNR